MSALENTSTTEQALVGHNPLSANATTDISVSTRIDYNLRFAKQAVLVIANSTEQYSQLASQYLVSLSNGPSDKNESHFNVAFVSASIKLNDIQIRCRLVEQLFINTLFDPEQSLAVSVLRFAKQQGEAISIVIDHAHALSLQLKYELSQLVHLAKKHNLIINVVLFGLTDAAKQLSSNKSLFKNKMAVIDAESGQVLSLDDKKIHHDEVSSSLTQWQKFSLFLVMLVLAGIVIWGYQLITEDFNKNSSNLRQESIYAKNSDTALSAIKNTDSSAEQIVRQMEKKQKLVTADNIVKVGLALAASAEEINRAILALPVLSQAMQVPANADDVINALAQSSNSLTTAVIPPKGIANKQVNDQGEKKPTEIVKTTTVTKIDNNYYQNQVVVYEHGYVIQLAGFSDKKLWYGFIDKYPTESLFSYQRLLAQQRFIVVTSKVYANKAMAKAALKLLPVSLSIREPWLKDISLVISEINTFKG